MAKKIEAVTGSVDVPLRKPITVSGVQISKITLREPTVGDNLAAQEYKGSEADKEIFLIACLAQITPDEVKTMGMYDFKKAQTAMMGFID